LLRLADMCLERIVVTKLGRYSKPVASALNSRETESRLSCAWYFVSLPYSSQQRPGRIFAEKLTVSDISREHCVARVPGLSPNAPGRDPGLGCTGGESCP
jgi:hypothetical protein